MKTGVNPFVQPDVKAVVSSQWTRTHDIVIRRLEERGIDYISFHGGVPSDKRPVLIVDFVAKGTIEEGMLSVPAFNRSLSSGILDGGHGEIALGGSRLSRFMQEVKNSPATWARPKL